MHKSDINLKEGFIHVHRQQLSTNNEFSIVDYTKEERQHPRGGRYVPITVTCEKIIRLAEQLPGKSDFLFHNKDGRFILKDSYEQNLNRRCKRLGISTKNNHAFRRAFNYRLIELNFSSADRACILGHAVETNMRHYSLTDNRRRYEMRDRLRQSEKESAETK